MPDGSIDTTFNNLQLSGNISRMHLLANGRILFAGSLFGGQNNSGVFRLLSNGMIDTTFSVLDIASGISEMAVSSNGEILVAGNFNNVQYPSQNYLTLLDSNGVVIPNFISPFQSSSFGYEVGFNSLNRIVASSPAAESIFFYDSLNILMPLSTAQTVSISDLSFDDFGNTYAFGNFSWVNGEGRNKSAKFDSNGNLDKNFNVVYGSNSAVTKMSYNSTTDEIYVAGMTSFNNHSTKGIARLHGDGAVDSSFSTEIEMLIYDFTELSDSSLIVGGDLSGQNATTGRLIKLDRNGLRDFTFNGGQAGPDGSVRAIALQADGNVLIGGTFTAYGSALNQRLIRILPNGIKDNTFTAPATFFAVSPFTNYPIDISVLSSGKILVTGKLVTSAGNHALIRLNSNGTIDPTFVAPIFTSSQGQVVQKIHVLPNNKILIHGLFEQINGVPRRNIALLNENGSLDLTFNIYTTSIIDDFEYISSNEYAVSGAFDFNSITNTYQDNFKIIDSLGNLVNSSIYGQLGEANGIKDFELLPDGKMLISGSFTSFNNYGKNGIARVRRCASLLELDSIVSCSPFTWINGQTYSTDTSGVYFSIPGANQCDSLFELNLSFIPAVPIQYNIFSVPSDTANCNGAFGISLTGNNDFILNFNSNSQIDTTAQNGVFDSVCGGAYPLMIMDRCGDTLTIPVVVPVDSNYIFINPFVDSLAVDSLGIAVQNCLIYYNSIDTIVMDSIWNIGNIVTVIWNIIDSSGSNFDTVSYTLNNGAGVYFFQFSIFCSTEFETGNFTITQAIWYNNGSISTVGIEADEIMNVILFPNPTREQLNVKSDSQIEEIIVYTINGEKIRAALVNAKQGTIHLSEIAKGMYFVEIKTNKGKAIRRIVLN